MTTSNNILRMENLNTTTLHSSAVLVDLNIKIYSSKVTDKEVNADVAAKAGASEKAGKYQKDLLAGNERLKAVVSKASEARQLNKKFSMSWNDNGIRVLPVAKMMDHKAQLDVLKAEFFVLVDEFCNNYETDISAAAFALGALFKRDEYPTLDEVRSKFAFNVMYSPLPKSGDFRVDISETMKQELMEHFESQFKDHVTDMMREPWQRLHSALKHMSEKLDDEGDKKARIFKTFLSNNEELIDALKALNVVNDPDLAAATREFEQIINQCDLEGLKKDEYLRKDVKAKVDDILSVYKFDW